MGRQLHSEFLIFILETTRMNSTLDNLTIDIDQIIKINKTRQAKSDHLKRQIKALRKANSKLSDEIISVLQNYKEIDTRAQASILATEKLYHDTVTVLQ